ncbi:MAG TPA: tRNA pseudouridine(55) synthase TruB [Pyrinomonadaceae bacterium]|jgi:tRNA pseudouridine55 synthase|nr:tRNA pseudouridine(55) synthase TruB [Pyrinomonadaceae bacterium]
MTNPKSKTHTTDGILVIDKPVGWTSHDVVARVRRILRERRVGHTGTLDPFATGVLVMLVGRATRLAQFLAGAEKEYEATIRLGFATDTGDLTGAPREAPPGARDCATLDATGIEAALATLRGEIEQVPPMYSAKKIEGRKLYELARRGEEIERKAVRVCVGAFEIISDEPGAPVLRRNEDGTCDFKARVVCSAGTYVRSLAESVGEKLSTGAHLSALRRTRAGDFRVACAQTLEELQASVEAGRGSEILLSPDAALPALPFVHLSVEDERRVRHGGAVPLRDAPREWRDGELVRMRDGDENLLAVGVYSAVRAHLQPRVMLAAEENKP